MSVLTRVSDSFFAFTGKFERHLALFKCFLNSTLYSASDIAAILQQDYAIEREEGNSLDSHCTETCSDAGKI